MKINKGILKGSFILLISFNIYNLFNFIFHFAMARMLTVADYGILVALYSIIYILAVFTESIQIVVTKYSAQEKNPGKLKNLFLKSIKKASSFSLIIFAGYLVLAIPLSFLLNINYFLLSLNGLIIFLAFITPTTRGLLQGEKKFKSLGLVMITESAAKLALSVFFVYIGWAVFGAITATLIAISISFLFSLFFIRGILKSKEEGADTKGIYGYTKPASLIILAVTLLYSLDAIIAKIVFPAELAGAYAIASTLGKIIFLGTQPIGKAMFPITAESRSKNEKSDNAFYNALIILFLVVGVSLALLYIFPELIIKIFTGRLVQESVRVLFFVGLGVSLISFANLILFHKLSIGRVRNYIYLFIFVIIEIILLFIFSKDLLQFSLAFITSSAIFLWGSIFILNE